jgi:hypothetical protein
MRSIDATRRSLHPGLSIHGGVDMVALAKALRSQGRRISLRQISAELADRGFVTPRHCLLGFGGSLDAGQIAPLAEG